MNQKKKKSRVTYISGGRSRLTLNQKFTTHVRLSVKFTTHHMFFHVTRLKPLRENILSDHQMHSIARECNILSLQLSQSNSAKCNQP